MEENSEVGNSVDVTFVVNMAGGKWCLWKFETINKMMFVIRKKKEVG